jgi:hypothetical protein
MCGGEQLGVGRVSEGNDVTLWRDCITLTSLSRTHSRTHTQLSCRHSNPWPRQTHCDVMIEHALGLRCGGGDNDVLTSAPAIVCVVWVSVTF